jgi:hypothetical protein
MFGKSTLFHRHRKSLDMHHRSRTTHLCISLCLLLSTAFSASLVHAQEVKELSLKGVPPDLIQDGAPRSASMAPPSQNALPDLGQDLSGSGSAVTGKPLLEHAGNSAALAAGRAARAGGLRQVTDAGSRAATARAGGAERAVFAREPVRVALPIGRERMITLPAPAALHVPTDIESVARLEIIDRTLYATALVPFTPLRIVAELIDSGQQIPMDLVANEGTASASGELQVSVLEPGSGTVTDGPAVKAAAGTAATNAESSQAAQPQAADMVQLTRHAARQLYAPRRLAWSTPGVYQVAVSTVPVGCD